MNANDDDGQSSVLTYELFVSMGGTEEKYDEFYQNKNDMLAVRRANLAEKQKYKNKAVIMEDPLLPGADVFQVSFISMKNETR